MRRQLTRLLPFAAASLIGGCTGATDPHPGAAAGIVIASGNLQQAVVGTALPAPIAVKVVDAKGRGVPGAGVEFTLISGSGHLTSAEAVTNASGIATAVWTLGTHVAELQRVGVSYIDPLTGTPTGAVFFRATPVAGPLANIDVVSGDVQSGLEHQRLRDSLVVRTTDIYHNDVPNVPVTFAVVEGGGSVSPATVTSDANARAATLFTLGTFGLPQAVNASATHPQTGFVTHMFMATATRAREGTSVALSSRAFGLAVSSHDVVYVGRPDEGTLTRFDGSSTTVTGGVAVGSLPTAVAFNASGTKAYVTNQFDATVGVVDVATNVESEAIPVTGYAFAVLVSPDESRIYVTTNADSVYAIDLATKTVVGRMATGYTANALAVNGDGSRLYVSTRDGGSVIEVNTASMTATRTFTTGGTTQQVVLAPDASELYVVTEQGSLYIHNLGTGALAGSVYLGGAGPFGMALTPDGAKLYITVAGTGTVQVVDRATRTITRSYFVDGTPRRIGFTSSGTAIVSNENGYVTWLP